MQFDLVFDRPDRVLTVCEIKYTSAPPGLGVAQEFLRKISAFKESGVRRYRGHRIQKVLITLTPPTDGLVGRAAFDRIVLADDVLLAGDTLVR